MAAVTQAETQLANTSLNGIDLFNTISDETTIPTVVESLNAQIEESCHASIKPRISSSEELSTNLRIKQEEECKSKTFFLKFWIYFEILYNISVVIENSFVPCRAYASLPTQYLYLSKNNDGGKLKNLSTISWLVMNNFGLLRLQVRMEPFSTSDNFIFGLFYFHPSLIDDCPSMCLVI